MEYCLIEKWHSEYSLPKGCRALGISPNACYELEKSGLEYFVFEDFCPRVKTANVNIYDYTKEQLSWFEWFDQFIQETFPEAKEFKLQLASLYFYNIKVLTDQLITQLNILNKFIDTVNPSKIWYIQNVRGEDKFDNWHWFHFGKNSYFKLIEPLCENRGLICEELIMPKSENITVKQKEPLLLIFSEYPRLKQFIRLKFPQLHMYLKTLKSRYEHWKYLSGINSNVFRKKGNILIIKVFDHSKQFIIDAKREGYSIYFLDNDSVRTSALFSKKGKIPFKKKNNIKINSNLNLDDAMQKIMQGPIMNWINNKCGIDVSDLLASRFEYLLKDLFPTTIGLIMGFTKYYDLNNIDYVFTNNLYTNYDFAAMAAARASQKTKSVGFWHGVDACIDETRYFKEFSHFDIYFTGMINETKQIKELSNHYGYEPPIVNTYPYFLNNFTDVAKKRKQVSSLSKKREKKIVLFLPIIRKYRNSSQCKSHLQTMEAIRWHNALINYFSSRTDYEFIWKNIIRNEFFDDSIYLKFQDNQYENIRYEDKPLKKYLLEVDKVICDLPSTGFFECVFSGLPVVTFKDKENNRIREDALSMLGNSLKSYSTIDDKLKITERFIDDNPEKYFVKIPEEKSLVIKVLNDNLIHC